MGFMRRRRQRRDESAPPDLAPPPGTAWEREDAVDDWALRLASETINRMGDDLPEYLNDSADVALEALRGMEPAQQFPDETHRLAFNLVLAGYWSRVTVMHALQAQDSSAELTSLPMVAPPSVYAATCSAPNHPSACSGTSSRNRRSTEEQSELLWDDLVAALPDDAGEPIRLRLGEHSRSTEAESASKCARSDGILTSSSRAESVWLV